MAVRAGVDEATGYQYERPRRDLEEQLAKFLSESLRKWVRTFPADYFKHLCRLRGVDLRPDMKLPQYFGHLTNNLIYRRIAPGLLHKLKERREERGRLGLPTGLCGSETCRISSASSGAILKPESACPGDIIWLGISCSLRAIPAQAMTWKNQLVPRGWRFVPE